MDIVSHASTGVHGAAETLDIHVVGTFDCIDPDGGSEYWIGWSWLMEISRRVRRMTAVVNPEMLEQLATDVRAPCNVEFVSPSNVEPPNRRVHILPRYYRNYIAFHRSAAELLADIEADVAHQLTLGSPYWGSAIASSSGRRILGPVGISSPAGWRMSATLGARELGREATRSALLHYPLPPVAPAAAIRAAHHVLAVDDRTAALAKRLGRPFTPMLQDGANPVPTDALVPVAERTDLMWAGRMMARKGAPLAVRAFARALPRLPASTRLVMIGDGADMSAVARLVTEHGLQGRVELPGFLPRVDTLAAIRCARALVFSSLRDTFGGVVLEAAERATPCVASLHNGVDGLRTWWPSDGGWFGQARGIGDMIETLADGMVQAVTCDDTDWNHRAKTSYHFAERHDWCQRGDELIGVYRAALLAR